MITPINNFNNLFEDWNKKNKTTYNPMDAGLGFLYGADALLSYNQELRDTTNRENMMRDRFRDNSIYDYNQMYGRNTNGGSQYQPVIMAEDGAVVRTETSKLDPINVESGEVLLLPDGNLEVIKGKKHSKGGVNTVLPQGAIVFSNKLKPENADKTFAELAKESDYTREKKVLENPYSSDAERKSAELMFNRKKNLLMELLEEQQYLNNDSSGEPMMKKGGKVMYAKGGVFPPGEGPVLDPKKGKYDMKEVTGSPFNEVDTFDPSKGKKYWEGVLKDLKTGDLKELFKNIELPENWNKQEANKFVTTLQQTFNKPEYKPLVDDYMQRVDATNKGRANSNADSKGFFDNLAFFRMPNARKANAEEWNNVDKTNPIEVNGKKYYFNKFKNYGVGEEANAGLGEYVYYDEEGNPQVKTNPEKIEEGNTFPKGNQYNLSNTNEKPGYNKRNLPFYQAAPEMLGFLSSMNTYNYWTPDYNHWEIAPPTLNIQSNLESIDSSMNAMNATTTGDPRIDNNRKSANYIQALNQKQQAFQNKQNYDAEGRFRADQFNIGERLKERDNDIKAASLVYNEYMPLAKDYATGERLNAISSLVEKVGMNKQNENLKKLYLDNFYENVFMDDEGNMKINSRGNFNENYYPSSSDKSKKEKLFEPITPLDIYDEVTPIKKRETYIV